MYGTAAGGYGVYCASAHCGGDSAWVNNSDIRLKTAIRDLPEENGLSAIMKLRPVRYHWKDKKRDSQTGERLAFIAQETGKVFPEVVTEGLDTTIDLGHGKTEAIKSPKAMSYAEPVVPLVKAVQELKADSDNLRHEFEAYKAAHP